MQWIKTLLISMRFRRSNWELNSLWLLKKREEQSQTSLFLMLIWATLHLQLTMKRRNLFKKTIIYHTSHLKSMNNKIKNLSRHTLVNRRDRGKFRSREVTISSIQVLTADRLLMIFRQHSLEAISIWSKVISTHRLSATMMCNLKN